MSALKLFKTLMAGLALVNLWHYLSYGNHSIVWGLCVGGLVGHLIAEAMGTE